jgi:hypothetical protein
MGQVQILLLDSISGQQVLCYPNDDGSFDIPAKYVSSFSSTAFIMLQDQRVGTLTVKGLTKGIFYGSVIHSVELYFQ